jgi:predicted PurR-regulated permease PerM
MVGGMAEQRSDAAGAVAVPPSRAQQAARAALALLLGLLGLYTLRAFLPALAWAVILAVATWPLYRRARRRWPARGHDIALPLLFALAVALGFLAPLAVLAVQLGHDARGLLQWWHAVQRGGGMPVPGWIAMLPFGAGALAAWWRDTLGDPAGTAELLHRIDRGEAIRLGRHIGAELLHRAVLFGFAILTLFFLYRDGARLAAQVLRAARRLFGPRGEPVLRQMVASVHGTVDGLVLVALGEGVVMGIAYAAAGVPHPTLMGALTAIAAVIPFAAPLVFGLAAVLLAAQGATAAAVAILALGFAVLFVADHLVRPALIGGATRMPFLLVLLGILGGVEGWGLLGLFLGPAIMAALVLLWREWTAEEAPPPPA